MFKSILISSAKSSGFGMLGGLVFGGTAYLCGVVNIYILFGISILGGAVFAHLYDKHQKSL